MELVAALMLSLLGIAFFVALVTTSADASIDELEARLHDDGAGEEAEPDLAAIHRASLAEYAAHGGEVEDPDPWPADDDDADADEVNDVDGADDDAFGDGELDDEELDNEELDDDEPWFAPRDEPGEVISTQPFEVPASFYAAQEFEARSGPADVATPAPAMTTVYTGRYVVIVAGMLRANGIDARVVKRGAGREPYEATEVRVPGADAEDARRLIADAEPRE